MNVNTSAHVDMLNLDLSTCMSVELSILSRFLFVMYSTSTDYTVQTFFPFTLVIWIKKQSYICFYLNVTIFEEEVL